MTGEGRDDEVEALLTANTVVAVGTGVSPDDYPKLEPLIASLGAELAATRKVTDKGWLPRARQVGLTGQSVDPALFLAIGASGKFNHMVGARGAGIIVAVNHDPERSGVRLGRHRDGGRLAGGGAASRRRPGRGMTPGDGAGNGAEIQPVAGSQQVA